MSAHDSILRDTTPWVDDHTPPTVEARDRERLYEAWRSRNRNLSGVSSRHAWNAAFEAGRRYEQEHS